MRHLTKAPPLLLALLLAGAAAPVPKSVPKQPVRTAAKPAAKSQAKAKPVAKPQPTAAKPAPDVEAPKTYPPQSLSFAQGVTMTQMVYRSLPGFRPLTLDLYASNAKGFPRPGLIFLHGGDWQNGDSRHAGSKRDLPATLAGLAARGFVVASVEYRLSGEARFPGALQDVKSAVRWLRSHKDDWNLDDTRIAAWGQEAGGYLAAMAGTSCGVAPLEPEADPLDSAAKDKPPSDCVQAVIAWSSVSDFENLAADLGQPAPDKSAGGRYLGCEPAACPPGTARNASPLTYITAMSPPFLIQHGGKDSHVSPKQAQRLYDGLRAKGVPAELVIYPEAASELSDSSDAAAALEKLQAFLDANFPKKPATSPYNPPQRQGLPY